MKNFGFSKDSTAVENLSTSKRRFIEHWRQNVSMFMENGNICRVTIGEVTPEPANDTAKWHNAENMKALTGEMSPRGELMASPSLPAVRFSYSHGQDDHVRHQKTGKTDKSREAQNRARTTLPPSPNGIVVQNGMDLHQAYKRRTSAMRAIENNMAHTELPEMHDNKDLTRKSSQLAREIYEKYNMKSKTHNALPGKHMINGFEQYTMPWRNKTFLSLPLRFNGTLQQKNSRLAREKTYLSEMRCVPSDADDDMKFTDDWKDLNNW